MLSCTSRKPSNKRCRYDEQPVSARLDGHYAHRSNIRLLDASWLGWGEVLGGAVSQVTQAVSHPADALAYLALGTADLRA